jgi:CRP-like cAMP-binding protein
MADHLRYAPFTAGETITKQGAVAHWLYILKTGTADIRTNIEGQTKIVAKLTAPTFFGEMGMMTGEPRTADVVATSEVECFRLDKEGFQKIIEERPEVATEMSENMAERRVELMAVREGLDEDAKKAAKAREKAQIFGKIQDFFGLGRATNVPR